MHEMQMEHYRRLVAETTEPRDERPQQYNGVQTRTDDAYIKIEKEKEKEKEKKKGKDAPCSSHKGSKRVGEKGIHSGSHIIADAWDRSLMYRRKLGR